MAAMISGRSFVALFLVLRKRDGDCGCAIADRAGQSSTSRQAADARHVEGHLSRRAGRLLEQQPDWVWTAVEAQELGATLSTATGDSQR